MRYKVDYIQDDRVVLYSDEHDSYIEIPKFLASDLDIGNVVDISMHIKLIAQYEVEPEEIIGGFKKLTKKKHLED